MDKYAKFHNTVIDMPVGSWRKKKRSRVSEDTGLFYKKYIKPKLKYCFAAMRQKSAAKQTPANEKI